MKKILKENCLALSIYDLKRPIASQKRHYSAVISWNEHNRLSILIETLNGYIELEYWIGEKQIRYKVNLVSTNCHYGNERYWFICPNNNCSKRVAILYLAPNQDKFFCRHCLNLSYKSRNINNKGRFAYIDKMLKLEQKVKRLKGKIKNKYRKGWPTKKYLRLMQTNNDLELAINIANQKMNKMLEK